MLEWAAFMVAYIARLAFNSKLKGGVRKTVENVTSIFHMNI
jgi:hypothetical protein